MNPSEFRKKWQASTLSERSASQQHFLDLCALVDHPTPAAADPTGASFTFERGASKRGGGDGWADVWKKGFFGWEYKGKHKDLDAAYDQLLKYREALENPPLLVVCDMDRLVVHTNFTNSPTVIHELTLDDLETPRGLEVLRSVFHNPSKLKPGATSQAITSDAAAKVAEIARRLRERGVEPEAVARFLDRIVFCLFAEDVELLPRMLFTRMLERTRTDPDRFANLTRQIFEAMAHGGDFGVDEIPHFDGHLFEDAEVVPLTRDEIDVLLSAASLDWSAVDPSILGTLFERGLDPDKRSQLGAHYTSREDIETLIEPVIMTPLRREWEETKAACESLLSTGKRKPSSADSKPTKAALTKGYNEAKSLVQGALYRLAEVKVLDPACGSGNFLYVTLQKLKDLEKEIIVWAMDNNLGGFFPNVGPWQLHGIEVNRYAVELAQMSVWIGFLQWTKANGFPLTQKPILSPMDTFERKDAILDLSDPTHPREPDWPPVDFIVGNPPFLGNRKMRRELGSQYVDHLVHLYGDRLGGLPDLCCFWFERSRVEIESGRCSRAGLLATQAIRGGTNRNVLHRITAAGGIFFAESDRPWVLDGATVHVAMVGFDDGTDDQRQLDGEPAAVIYPNLTSVVDTTQARRLRENAGLSFQGAIRRGGFDVTLPTAVELLADHGNPNGRPNSDVVLPYFTGDTFLKRLAARFVIQFPPGTDQATAAAYEAPFRIVEQNVKPDRQRATQEDARAYWWLHWCYREDLENAISSLPRYVVTPRVSKHRVFLWGSAPAHNDAQLIVFPRSDSFFFGVLHSRPHEVWARAQGTQVRDRESGFRYTPKSCFRTFPLPWRPGTDSHSGSAFVAISEAADNLNELREQWLNPDEWVLEEILEFPGSIDGPWSRWVHDPDERGIGTVRWPRVVPRDAECAAKLKRRTLTNLYNQRPTWLELAHRKLDEAVFAAYGWPVDLSDDELLERLLALNLERAAAEAT